MSFVPAGVSESEGAGKILGERSVSLTILSLNMTVICLVWKV